MGVVLLAVYVTTMAPGVTFWDAGEFIAAAHTLGIPHPPGTPLFVALGRVWTLALGTVTGVARASNLLSAVSTGIAGALAVRVVARAAPQRVDVAWGAIAGALCAGVMSSVWANATETEVYAVSLLHVMLLLACAQRASGEDEGGRWLLCTAYVIALAPAVHLSALIGAPAGIVLSSRRADGKWCVDRMLLLGGVLVAAAGVGRMSWLLAGCGAVIAAAPLALPAGNWPPRRVLAARVVTAVALTGIAASALLIMLIRARHDPAVNQGNPSTLGALADVIARRQYDVAPMWPRRAPAWLQLANLLQYLDWQFALAWGRGIFTTPARVITTLGFLLLGGAGWRAMHRDVPRLAAALAMLAVSGTIGVAAYLNLKAGATLGYGFVPADAHEARERDYFFVPGFWAWGLFAGYGALAFVRRRSWPVWVAAAVAVLPIAANWRATNRRAGDGAWAPREVARALLTSVPPRTVLFVAGDNDTYPLWYLQRVEGVRPDVMVVTFPLLPADWYVQEIARRTGLRWPATAHVAGARWQHEERAALIARAARNAGWAVGVSTGLPSAERRLLGSGWRLRGATYVSSAAANGIIEAPVIDSMSVPVAWRNAEPRRQRGASRGPDDVSAAMLALLDCARIGRLPQGRSAARDSLEVGCNFR